MHPVKWSPAVFALIASLSAASLSAARAEPVCDAPTEGGRVTLTMEVTGVSDSAPARSGADWVVERTTTVLPLCNYFSPVGSYSLKSYSLDPEKKTERVTLCRAGTKGLTAVAPYTGSCPPK
jgi:hypothetical protein